MGADRDLMAAAIGAVLAEDDEVGAPAGFERTPLELADAILERLALPPSPAQWLERFEAWRVARAAEQGPFGMYAREVTDPEAVELARGLAALVATLVGRPLADDDDVSRAGWLAAIDPRARKAIEVAEAYGIDLTDGDTQELFGLDREWVWGDQGGGGRCAGSCSSSRT